MTIRKLFAYVNLSKFEPHLFMGVGFFKLNQMATKKAAVKAAPTETARLTIVCDSSETCSVKIKGDRQTLTAALACLMATEDENNAFREMMSLAIQVVIAEDKSKKAAKKKAVTKKAAPKKAAPKKK